MEVPPLDMLSSSWICNLQIRLLVPMLQHVHQQVGADCVQEALSGRHTGSRCPNSNVDVPGWRKRRVEHTPCTSINNMVKHAINNVANDIPIIRL